MFGSGWSTVLQACRLGAEWAWREVYLDLSPALVRYHRARGTPDPEDLVGDTFVRVVRALSTFEGNEEQFRAWVFAISQRRAIDLARSRARRPESPTEDQTLTERGPRGDAEQEAIASLDGQEIRRVLKGLTRDQRDVLLLRLLADLTVEEVARVLEKSEGAVKALQARGLEHVRREISRGAVTF